MRILLHAMHAGSNKIIKETSYKYSTRHFLPQFFFIDSVISQEVDTL